MVRGVVLAAIGVAVLAAGCASAQESGTLVGKLEVVGGPSPGLARPLPGTVTATNADGKKTFVTIGANGKFEVQLPPGSYSLMGHSPQVGGGTYPCTGGTVHVSVTSRRSADVACQVP